MQYVSETHDHKPDAPSKVHDRTANGYHRQAEVVEAVVDDPLGTIPGEKIKVTRSVRDDPLAGMLARDQIDQAMYEAGRQWQKYAEWSEIGSISAIDPTKEAVDGGRPREILGDRQLFAFEALRDAKNALGWEGDRLIVGILNQRRSIQEYGMSIGFTTEREFNYIGRRLRECLDTLAKLWGLA